MGSIKEIESATSYVAQLLSSTAVAGAPEPNRAVAFSYERFSTDLQDPVSIDIQRDSNRVYCAKSGFVLKSSFADYAMSGRTTDRDALEECLRACEAHPGCNLVVYSLDRIWRSEAAYHEIQNRLMRANVRLHHKAGEVSDIERQFLSIFAIHEVKRIQERTTDGRNRAIRERNVWIGPTPLGYDKVDKTLRINPESASIVKELFERFAAGATIASLVRWLENDLSLPPPGGGTRWYNSTVRAMLGSSIYVGVRTYGRKSR